jgi:hypothetical protein
MAYTSHFSERFPDLFDQLTDEQAFRVTQILASSYLEGYEPTRDHVSDLIDVELGRITGDEARNRIRERSKASKERKAPE